MKRDDFICLELLSQRMLYFEMLQEKTDLVSKDLCLGGKKNRWKKVIKNSKTQPRKRNEKTKKGRKARKTKKTKKENFSCCVNLKLSNPDNYFQRLTFEFDDLDTDKFRVHSWHFEISSDFLSVSLYSTSQCLWYSSFDYFNYFDFLFPLPSIYRCYRLRLRRQWPSAAQVKSQEDRT